MPGMAEEEMLGDRPNKLKLVRKEFKVLREEIRELSDKEGQNSIEFIEISLKNKLYRRTS